MSTTTKTYETIAGVRAALPDLPEGAVIRDRDGDTVTAVDVPYELGDFAPYTVTYEVPDSPAPLDPSKVKVGDTVTVSLPAIDATATGRVVRVDLSLHGQDATILLEAVGAFVVSPDGWTLTDHQPAPEPEPEWKHQAVWADWLGRRYLAGTNVKGERRLYGEDGCFVVPPMDGLRPLVVIDPAKVDRARLQSVYGEATERMAHANGIIAVLAELGIEAS